MQLDQKALAESLDDISRMDFMPYAYRGILRAAAEVLAALKPQEPDKWQPIDTAPKHGDCLVFGGRHKAVTILPADGDWWREMQKEGSNAVPTHWMPLPAPPSLPTTAGGGHDT